MARRHVVTWLDMVGREFGRRSDLFAKQVTAICLLLGTPKAQPLLCSVFLGYLLGEWVSFSPDRSTCQRITSPLCLGDEFSSICSPCMKLVDFCSFYPSRLIPLKNHFTITLVDFLQRIKQIQSIYLINVKYHFLCFKMRIYCVYTGENTLQLF